MVDRIALEFTGKDVSAGKTVEDLQAEIRELEKLVERLTGEKIDFDSEPAEADLQELQRELKRLERAFDRAEKSVSFARAQKEIERTTQAARRLATAEAKLAARGKELIDFSKRLPAPLKQGAAAMDRLERQTEQATAAFRRFQTTAGRTKKNFSSLVSSIGQLRTGVGLLIAGLGIQQILRFGRALVDLGGPAVETKIQFDRLIPTLRAFTGSTEAAQDVADQLTRIADELKSPVSGLIQPFLRLNAAVKETNLTTTEQIDLFESALLTTRAFGLTTEETSRLVTGFAQVAGKGALSMEELRQQIGEVAFNALPALAKELGTTTTKLIEDVSRGAVDAETALRGLAAGLRAANEEAGRANVATLAGDIGDFQRAAEQAQKELADGFEPGLRSLLQTTTEFIEKNPELIRQIGEIGSAGLESFAGLVDVLSQARDGFTVTGTEALALANALRSIPDAGLFGPLEEKLRAFGNILASVAGQARDTFEAIEKGARVAALGVAKSAEEIQESFEDAFEEAAKAAGIAAEDIEEAQKDVADRVGAIAEGSAQLRADLEEKVVQAAVEGAEDREEIERRAAEEIFAIERRGILERQALLVELVAETQRAAAERIRIEAEAAAERAKFLDETVAKAREVAAQRIEVDQQAADKIAEIEAQLAEKILAARAKADEALAQQGANREKIAQELTDKIVALERAAADKIVAEQERIAKAAEAAAERRIAAEKKVQEAFEKSLEQVAELIKSLREAAEGEGDDGGAFDKIKKSVDEATESVQDLLEELARLQDPGTLGEDPARLLELAFKKIDEILGVTAQELGFFRESQEETAESTRQLATDLDEKLLGALRSLGEEGGEAFSKLSEGAQAAVLELVQRFTEIADSGQTTEDDIRRFVDALDAIFGDLGDSLTTPAEKLKEKAKEIVDAQEEIPEKAEEAAERTKVAWDPVTKTMESVEESTAGAAEGMDKVADAAERFPEEIVPEATPETLRELGVAATEAAPPIEAMAEPLAAIATSAGELAEKLPVLAGQVPIITAAVTALFEALAENPVDLAEIAAQVERIGEPLTLIQEQLAALTVQVQALPEPLTLLQEQLGPLLDGLLTAADDDRVGRIATGFGALAEKAGEAADPLKSSREALDGIVENSVSLLDALDGATARFNNLGSEETTGGLEKLFQAMENVSEQTERLATESARVLETFVELQPLVPVLEAEVDDLADSVRDALNPALLDAASNLDKVKTESERTREELVLLRGEIETLADEGVPRLEDVRDALREIAAAAREAAAAVRELAAATREVQAP